MRRGDPAAAAALAELVCLEGGAWTSESARAYGDALLTLALRCEATPDAVAVFYGWIVRRCGSVANHDDPRVRAHALDAIADVAVSAVGLLLRLRAGVDHQRRPNLQSIVWARVGWRAREAHESTTGRHERRQGIDPDGIALARAVCPGADPETATMAREVVDALATSDDAADHALALVGAGWSLTAAARRCGVSRQAVYRRRDRL